MSEFEKRQKPSLDQKTALGWEPWVLAFACLLPTAVTLVYFVAAAGSASSVQQAVYACAKALQFALPVLWVGIVCRQRLAWPRWNPQGVPIGLTFGLAVAFGVGVLYWLISKTQFWLDALEPIQEKVRDIGITSPVGFLALGVFYALIHSLLEEYYWRWFVFGRLRPYLPVTMAIVLSSIAFALHHVIVLWAYFSHAPTAAIVLAFCVAVGGAGWAWIYHRTGSMYAIWFSHAIVDAAIFAVGFLVATPVFSD